ncbi:hypothetical protein I307_03685 [Cryptococcus deuterogattii 99/473]|uniref:Uncharacterized protein n=1 Tax=Cryptococcus deuterogattii Ram5 TaxID=1296110 RepID=A0A0D0VED9_9TREE|nr:hypothetical protein I313_00076 [Cryptococcus deuterogattii Ram5]KIS01671.1 hypothetical protein L804_01550 [Cryptococcus deuterogattii 2001/935-1]KIY56947.1 hypothetical protein I307_03685 [Cryptococcus deuterogattii 99/473]
MPKDPPKRRGRPPHLYKLGHTAPPATIGHIGSTLASMTTTVTSLGIHTTPQTQVEAISHALTLHEAQIHNPSLGSDCTAEQASELATGTTAAATATETTTTTGESFEPQIHVTSTGTWVGLPLNPHRVAERQALWDLVASCDYTVATTADVKADLNLEALNGLQSAKLDATMNNGFVKPTRQKKIEGQDYFSQVINVEDIPKFFDGLPHDYNVLSRARMSCYFRIIWLDPPGLIPTDIRYRHILVSVDAMALRNNPAGYVYRIMFKCSGSCMRMDEGPCHLQEGNTASKLDGSSFVGDNDAYDQPAQPGETRGPKSRKKRPAACDSMLMLEMTARQAANGQCTIVHRRPEFHPAGPANALRMSAYVRSVLHELAAQTGMPHHRLRYEYEERLRYAPYPAMLETHLPHRAPKPRHYPSVVTTITRNQQKPNTEGSGD